jgi:hypothetical protein
MSNLIEWGRQDHVIRQGLLQKSDMVFSSNSKTRKWCLALPPYEQGHASYIKEFKSLKPCIHGSDAHNLDSLGKPCSKRGLPEHDCVTKPDDCDHRYCWIKADPTFEGLKQIKYEPEDRVRIQASDPAPLKSNYCISAFEMEEGTVNAELKLRPINLELSTALVAVT